MFKHLGYFKEYYINNKFIGTINCEMDREIIGYHGRKNEVLLDKIKLDNGKSIKKNIQVLTILYPLCGEI